MALNFKFPMVGSKRAFIITGASLYVLLSLILLKRKKKTKAKYVTNLDAIGLRVEGNDIAVDAPEYDVVVVGGGKHFAATRSRFLVHHQSCKEPPAVLLPLVFPKILKFACYYLNPVEGASPDVDSTTET